MTALSPTPTFGRHSGLTPNFQLSAVDRLGSEVCAPSPLCGWPVGANLATCCCAPAGLDSIGFPALGAPLQMMEALMQMLWGLLLGQTQGQTPTGAFSPLNAAETPSIGAPSPGRPSPGAAGAFGQTPAQSSGKSRFNIASFNVLGSSHTAAGGTKADRASGVSRMRGAVAALKSHNVDLAGLQEFQGDQQAAFKRLAPGFGVVAEKDNAIVYNKKKFRVLEHRSLTIPYFEGHPRKMPVVKLEDKSTGQQMWVVNIHNPADTKDHPHNAKNRAVAIEREQRLLRQLQATGLPVLFTGDFNDRTSVNSSMNQARMNSSANAGSDRVIDYIFGSAGVQFSNYAIDRHTQSSGVSDHPMIVSTAAL